MMNIGIEARVRLTLEGGGDQYLRALLAGLATRGVADQTYTIFATAESEREVRRWVAGRLVVHAEADRPETVTERTKRILGPVGPLLGQALRSTRAMLGRRVARVRQEVEDSDGSLEACGLDVLHFAYPWRFLRSRLPVVTTVYDLQHRHLPEFYGDATLEWLERMYPEVLSRSAVIVAISDWVKTDLIRQYGVPADRVIVAPAASPIRDYQDLPLEAGQELLRRIGAPPDFVLYPALTYGHKNHLRLLEAVATLRDRDGLVVHVVCTGRRRLYWPRIEKRRADLGLEQQVIFPGFVAEAELRCLYRRARAVVLPTLFEGAGLPALEACAEGTPLVCSDIPALREYAGQAASYFDPTSVDSIAEAVRRIWLDADLRRELGALGIRRATEFTTERMAAAYAHAYRVAGDSVNLNASHSPVVPVHQPQAFEVR